MTFGERAQSTKSSDRQIYFLGLNVQYKVQLQRHIQLPNKNFKNL